MTIQRVIRFQTSDGVEHASNEEATRHQDQLDLHDKLVSDFTYRTELQYWHTPASLAAVLRANKDLVESILNIEETD